ncbi:MAG TPA: hypothetical protein DCL76_07890 [Chloroflexi bacterium]|nr:hypothetical protein [Chloroflexota bacterium]|tara:strand:+ start:4534 stop:5901 length:1368 start_codon:yes stop_codon:yes gene_type:complete
MSQTKAELLQTKHQGELRLGDANSSHYVGFKAPATVSSSLVWTLPAADGTANYLLKTDGSGNLAWTADNSGVSLSGSTNNTIATVTGANALQGEAALTFDGNILQISHATPQFKSVDTDGTNDYSTFQNSSGQSVYNAVDNNTHGKHLFQTAGTERMRIDSSGNVGIGTTSPDSLLHLESVSSPGVHFKDTTNNCSLKCYAQNSNAHIGTTSTHDLIFDCNSIALLTLTTGRHIVTQGLTGTSFNNDTASAKILEVTGDGTVGEYGVINISGNQNTNNTGVGTLRFINRENSASSSASSANSKQIASIQSYIATDDTNAGDDSGGFLVISVKGNGTGIAEKLRITSSVSKFTGGVSQVATAAAALDLDLNTSNYFTKTISGNSTFTFSNPAASGTVSAFTLELTHSSGTVTWPSSVKWNADTAPTLTTGKTHLFMFVTDDGGSRYRGSALVDYVN